ncbi:hypothetical protein AGDE_07733 [Angomonas deanei]|uniref:Uncharacterized protein n=1 Tax=Angomonas deanei TaxID=59799 RepID=A0A7G2CE04_9TRYP|nr:hypothetical protein AGDE_07733 [Angomonas deanei]CAD2218088.1 hypothetical protein, conserved [Angomonas deanei]|eukprot:EPY34903.1 hypothetical protein AGDE_07733 [Angomonas deanei]
MFNQLPTTDYDRLIFYTEVLLVNIPSLIADLGSAKYALMSFSGKKREEVKQKSALIQSVSRTFATLHNVSKTMDQKEAQFRECEQELSSAAPPRFISLSEASQAQNPNETVIVLKDADIARLRKAEMLNGTFIDEMSKLRSSTDSLLPLITSMREEKTKAEGTLRSSSDALHSKQMAISKKRSERERLALLAEEAESRKELCAVLNQEYFDIIAQCRKEELMNITQCVEQANEDLTALVKESTERKERNEVELATLKIAYKELQGEAEVLKDNIKFLVGHQKDLERLAKQQQLEEKQKNSLKNLMWSTFTGSSADDASKQLKPQYEAELVNDHLLVSTLAATIHKLEQDRTTIAGFLNKIQDQFDNNQLNSNIEKIEDVLDSDLTLDDDAINDVVH